VEHPVVAQVPLRVVPGEKLAVAVDHGRVPWQLRMDQPPLGGGLEQEGNPGKRGENDSQGWRL